MYEVALAVIARVRNCAAGFGRLDSVLKSIVAAQRFDRAVDAFVCRELENFLDGI